MAKQFSFRGSLHGLKLDSGSFSKTFEAQVQVLIRNATREWLRAVVLRVRVWTGFSLGSVVFAQGQSGIGLARFLHMAVPVVPLHTTPKWYYPGFRGKVPKTPAQGAIFGEYNFPSSQHRYRFRYTNNVIQFGIGEFYGTPQSGGPWDSMRAGGDAFNAYLKENIHRLPQVKASVVKSNVVRLQDE